MAEKKVQRKRKKQLGSKTQKAKKKWFNVLAPENFNKKEIGEIPANEASVLIGRTIQTSFGELTGNRRDVFNKLLLKIIKVQGETVETEVKKFFVAESYIQSIHRRKKKRILVVFNTKTKDDKELKFKIYILAKENIHRSVASEIERTTIEQVSALAKKTKAEDILSIEGPKQISMLVKEHIKKLYPCTAIVWKIYNLSA